MMASREYEDLTPGAQAERDEFEACYGTDGSCSCHLSPPCPSCTHPGNPLNQIEDETAWIASDDQRVNT